MDDGIEAVRATYFEECAELLEILDDSLQDLSSGRGDAQAIGAMFRAVHSIKGGAAAFNLADLVSFAHDVETVLEGLRSGRRTLDDRVLTGLLRACDRLGDLVEAARTGTGAPSGPGDMRAWLEPDRDAEGPSSPSSPPSRTDAPMPWTITFRPRADLLETGNEPLFMFRAMAALGRLEVEADDSDLPALDALDPEMACLAWRILLTPASDTLTREDIEEVFEFASDLCTLTIEPPFGQGRPSRGGPGTSPSHRPSGPPSPGAPMAAASRAASSIRVDLARVDRLFNLIGELVIGQSVLAQAVALGPRGRVACNDAIEDLQRLTRDIQDSVMAIRAQPVKSLFQRMSRVVREVSEMTGKPVELRCEGVETEIDKTMVERLAEPLTHLIRNAIDHGLEAPDVRLARGKPEKGIVRLRARQQSDRVIVEVEDDGGGIDRTRVRERAERAGLIDPGEHLGEAQIDRLLFRPGFSTREDVSALSGRGVGMDVVHNTIRALEGTISMTSTSGEGCSVLLTLPLTLAILDGMVVRSAGQRMVLPVSTILEAQTRETAHIQRVDRGRPLAVLHNRLVPLFDLGRTLGFDGPDGSRGEDAALVFLRTDAEGEFALSVDAIEAQRQVVVKGIGHACGRVRGISAATILGDGQIALIVDPSGIAAMGARTDEEDREAEVSA